VSASAAVRARAAQIVADVAANGRSLDAAFEAGPRSGKSISQSFTSQQRGLLRSLCYDSIRWYVRLDALLERLLSRPGQKLDPQVRALAIVGLCQLLYTDIPAHAAVDETVNAARLIGQPRAAGLINAILRRAQREHARLGADVDRDDAVRSAHPRWLVQALQGDWGQRAEEILLANNQRPPFWIRVNRRRISGPDYRAQLESQGRRVIAARCDDEALLLESATDVAELPGFAEGAVSVQDAAAQLAAQLLAPHPGARVLDACAAPGGKTCHLLELQPELAEVIAVDVSAERLARVQENLQRLHLRAQLVCGDAAEPAGWWDGRSFDRILLDVPCSATGVIRRHPDIKLLRRPEDVPALAARQSRLLLALWPLLAPGGRLLYASCSVLAAETTAVVAGFLGAHADARDVTGTALRPLGLSADPDEVGYRIATGTAGMDGFYYAALEKT
jgi:16S rRNA (cytosine967-C5)-methyltransferase